MLKWPGAEGTKAQERVSWARSGIQDEWEGGKVVLLHRAHLPTLYWHSQLANLSLK